MNRRLLLDSLPSLTLYVFFQKHFQGMVKFVAFTFSRNILERQQQNDKFIRQLKDHTFKPIKHQMIEYQGSVRRKVETRNVRNRKKN